MFKAQYLKGHDLGARPGAGPVQTPDVNQSDLYIQRLDAIKPGTYQREAFVNHVVDVIVKHSGYTPKYESVSNWVTGLFKPKAQWARDRYQISRVMNGKKTDTVIFNGKVAAPAPAKAKAAPAPRKGKAKAKATQQQALPL